jgi:precorrin-2 dehydrogenase / sirohydrochlorin ferrochelatase
LNFRFPVFLDLTGKNCLVTGAGYEVPSKVQALVDAGANVTYINPLADVPVQALAAAGLIRWHERDFQSDDLHDQFLVISSHQDNSEIFRLAEEGRILCNSVDDPAHCRFTFGSIHRQGELTIAISTNGSAPALAVRFKEWLEREVGPEYVAFLSLLKDIRPEITSRIAHFSDRRALWYQIVDSDVLKLLRAGQNDEAKSVIRRMLEEMVSSTSRSDTSPGAGNH